MRVIFFGTSAFAVPSLDALVQHRHQVVMCVTQPDRPQGRGLASEPSPVKRAAQRLTLPLSQPQRPTAELVAGVQPDLGVVIAYGQLIRPPLLALPAHGMIGVHPSLLPRYRGAAPVAWAILGGETMTGVSIFRLSERLDAGEVILQQREAIDPHEDAERLTERLSRVGAQLLVQACEQIAAGTAHAAPQDEAAASVAPKLTKAQGLIDWNQPATAIERQIRALAPWPGAAAQWEHQLLKIWKADARPEATDAPPGTVVHADPEGLVVATGQGTLMLTDVQPAGKRRMSVREFLAGHHVRIGARFGLTGEA